MGNMLSLDNTYVKTAAIDVAIQWAMFAVSALLKTERFYDLTGSATFLYLTYQTLQWGDTHFLRQRIQSGMVMVWAMRLGLFLFTRVMKDGHDRRFDKVKGNPKIFFIYWTIQAVWIFITLLPTLILNNKKRDTPLGYRDYAGWTVWAVGFLFEVIADYQKSVFRNNPDNANKFISTGLWAISRHPNYFGEIMSWFGLYISASSTFQGHEYLSVLSPMFVAYLITRVSGIPILERSGMKRYGKDPAYLEYVKNTPSLVPFIG